jgi:GTP diphosphokinase / guanosine-3',5'-bis(diphosphate) 3'-diphosphatase
VGEGIVEEVTDTKWLKRWIRKRLQVSRAGWSSSAAKLVVTRSAICGICWPVRRWGWSMERQREYFDWAKSVIDWVRGANPRLEKRFDPLYGMRP